MISRTRLEAATALTHRRVRRAVVVSSLDNGIGWSSAGVDAGTFPFIIGLIILAGSLYNLAQRLVARPGTCRSRYRSASAAAALFVPAAVFVGVIPLFGIYLASAGYVFGALACTSVAIRFVAAIAVAIVTRSLY